MQSEPLSLPALSTNTPDAERAAEMARRRADRATNLWLEASVPLRFGQFTLDTFPVSAANATALRRVRWWMDGPPEDATEAERQAWADEQRPGLLLHGTFGTGKTGIAAALLRSYVFGRSEPALFVTVPDLLDAIRDSYHRQADAEQRSLLKRVKTVECLVLDDLGAERVTDWAQERLFVIVNARHSDDYLTTIFTSNLSPSELGAHLGERITWRIIEMCEIVKWEGPNLRDRGRA